MENKNIQNALDEIGNRLEKPVVLIGMMGAGKSHLGQLLAEALGLEFADSDQLVEQDFGYDIATVFKRDGEGAFRAAEKRIMADLLKEGIKVIATGGGAVMEEETADMIRNRALSVWVHADVKVLAERVAKNRDRPLLACGEPADILESLLKERELVYKKADITIRSDSGTVAETLDQLIAALREFLTGKNNRANGYKNSHD